MANEEVITRIDELIDEINDLVSFFSEQSIPYQQLIELLHQLARLKILDEEMLFDEDYWEIPSILIEHDASIEALLRRMGESIHQLSSIASMLPDYNSISHQSWMIQAQRQLSSSHRYILGYAQVIDDLVNYHRELVIANGIDSS